MRHSVLYTFQRDCELCSYMTHVIKMAITPIPHLTNEALDLLWVHAHSARSTEHCAASPAGRSRAGRKGIITGDQRPHCSTSNACVHHIATLAVVLGRRWQRCHTGGST